ncbi:hypothetical protein E2C01_031481 [Portunus trituberculatus]|uniref:Uncharacterized protein n=1 Tax=Portunus trituberculatus TaxID=210409 RepID=A0A5B7EXR1_PORTR|nr:hypothetical protein [Portunus trituberculatus]
MSWVLLRERNTSVCTECRWTSSVVDGIAPGKNDSKLYQTQKPCLTPGPGRRLHTAPDNSQYYCSTASTYSLLQHRHDESMLH